MLKDLALFSHVFSVLFKIRKPDHSAPIFITEAFNIILTEVITWLYLYYFEYCFIRVRKSMHLTKGYIGWLVFSQIENMIATGDLGTAFNYYPMLCSMIMFLQT